MAQQWLSVMDAAAALGVKPATVRHWIMTGRVASRFDESGRQVLIGEPDGTGAATPDAPRARWRRWMLLSWAAAAVLAAAAGGSLKFQVSSFKEKLEQRPTADESAPPPAESQPVSGRPIGPARPGSL